MIKRIQITNFKSLANVSVNLDPVTVFIGKSGSGKSNFVEACRWLRDHLMNQQGLGASDRIMCATSSRPMSLTFSLDFDAPGFSDEFQYYVAFQQHNEGGPLQFREEKLSLGSKTLFHQQQGKWISPPPLAKPPQAGQILLGGLTGFQEATIAHVVLTKGIGCYAFSDQVLSPGNQGATGPGFADTGNNFLRTFEEIQTNLSNWQNLRHLVAALRRFQPRLKTVDLRQPDRQEIVVTHEAGNRLQEFVLAQESEGLRRLLACLLALYQTPPKQTLIFDEPEKGLYPLGLAILADEFQGYAAKGCGQVLLTTHSPEFLDKFSPEQIRVVEMRDHVTQIGAVAQEQLEALREHFLEPRELLTVDEAQLVNPLLPPKQPQPRRKRARGSHMVEPRGELPPPTVPPCMLFIRLPMWCTFVVN